MVQRTPTERTCPKGHRYRKSTDCPTCPFCEAEKMKAVFFVEGLSAPARRALIGAGITSAKALAARKQDDVMALHGMGPASLPKMQAALKAEGLKFKA